MDIRLYREEAPGYTWVSNDFIDYYMPSANGEFVKLYLYLLRCLSDRQDALSVCTLADRFNNTEKDIQRALHYWEKEGLLTLETGTDGGICGICMRVLPSCSRTGRTAPSACEADAGKTSPAENHTESVKETTVETDSGTGARKHAAGKSHSISRERLSELQQQENICQLLFIAEQYLGKTLSSTQVHSILYMYDELHFSEELIEYLIEYCVSRGNRSMRYMETVALAWHEEHITTVEQAREVTEQYNKYVFTVLKSFGIKGRNPVASELAYIRKWSSDYGFPVEIISQACERTVTQIHQPSFEYADKILSNWNRQGVRHSSDILKLDTAHRQSQMPAGGSRESKNTDSRNRFNNFDQRSYDFNDLERQLLDVK